MEKIKPPAIPVPAVSSPNSIDESQRHRSRKSLIERCQRIIFSGYRLDQYSDPAGYVDSLNLVFGQYPNEVIKFVSDPRTGVQRDCEFPPTIAKIVAACDKRMGELARAKRYENWGKGDDPARIEPPRDERPTYEELKAKYGDNFGLAPEPERKVKPEDRAPTKEELAEHYAQYDLGFQPKPPSWLDEETSREWIDMPIVSDGSSSI